MKKLGTALSFFLILSVSFLFNGYKVEASPDSPTVWVNIYEIQKVDDIEGPLEGMADWHYFLWVWDGEKWLSVNATTNLNEDILIVNKTYSFAVGTTTTYIDIALLEDDQPWSAWDLADISGYPGGGADDWGSVTVPGDVSRGAEYQGTYNLKTNELTGDGAPIDLGLVPGYHKTSGDSDGSVLTDENDANLWFKVWDNYDAPTADAGPDQPPPGQKLYTADKVNFDGSNSLASSGSSIVKYEWDFETDGIIDAEGAKTSYTYNRKGTYTVTLKVTDDIGETDTDACTVTVLNRVPKVSFTYTPQPPNHPTIRDTVNFYDTSNDPDGSIDSWYWEFGDGSISTGHNPTHKYLDKGPYSVKLTVTDNDGGQNSTTKVITIVNLKPTANFTFSPSEPRRYQDIQFTDTSNDPEGKTLSYLWNFGDSYTSTTRNPTHKYEALGNYTVTLTVTDDEGATDTKSIIITIVNLAPTAAFTYSPSSPMTNQDVQFTDASTDPEEKLTSWNWNFGDGYTSTTQNPTHKYARAGTYTVTLTVMDDEGASDTKSTSITVQNTPPQASFTYTPSNPTIKDTVNFYDTSTDSDGSIVSWFWQFGDGSNSTERNPMHKYADKGQYIVTLTVTDNDGGTGVTWGSVQVVNLAPTANFTFSPSEPRRYQDIQFTDTSNDPEEKTLSYLWNFGDGYTSTTRNPTHKYEASGSYTISLTVTDDEGATGTKSIIITIVNLAPTASFTFTPSSPKVNDDVQFTDSSTDPEGKSITYLWDFGDTYTSTTKNPTHKYAKSGTYTVTLTVTDDEGASNTKTVSITVRDLYLWEQPWFYPLLLISGLIIVGIVVAILRRKRTSS